VDTGKCVICGDGVCDMNTTVTTPETCKNCAKDCGACDLGMDGCVSAATGTNGNSPGFVAGCKTAVCSKDDFCCTSAWDSVCVSECTKAGFDCTAGTYRSAAKSCSGAGCDCECAVCKFDGYCCNVGWDLTCAHQCWVTSPKASDAPPAPQWDFSWPPCASYVCSYMSSCCTSSWSSACKTACKAYFGCF
jgi:hypothetical protein